MNAASPDASTIGIACATVLVMATVGILVVLWQRSMDREIAKIREESNKRFDAVMAPLQAFYDSPGQRRDRLIAQVDQWHREGKL